MKIAFDVFNSGLGNNGGSRTIVKSANTLVDLGHEVYIFSHCPNMFTWNKLKAKHIQNSNPHYIFPKVDVIIATANTTAEHSIFQKAKLHTYWIRGIEVWNKPLDYLKTTWQLPFDFLMVNSEWQKEFIEVYTKLDIRIQYPGLELYFFVPDKSKRSKDFVKIGGLFHPAIHKGWLTFYEIAKKVNSNNIRFEVLSNLEANLNKEVISNVLVQPSETEKKDWYQSCDIWLATTNLDGLHLPPMEAGLCGASIITLTTVSSGVGDHAIHGDTALRFDSVEQAIKYIKLLVDSKNLREQLNNNHRKLLFSKMKSREEQMRSMIEMFSYEISKK